VHQRLAGQHRGVVGQELGGQVVGSVDQHVVPGQQRRGGLGGEAPRVQRHRHPREPRRQLRAQRGQLGRADPVLPVQHLPVQVAVVDQVVVDHAHGDARRAQPQGGAAAQPPRADEQHPARHHRLNVSSVLK
jgi:hypothetical protein